MAKGRSIQLLLVGFCFHGSKNAQRYIFLHNHHYRPIANKTLMLLGEFWLDFGLNLWNSKSEGNKS